MKTMDSIQLANLQGGSIESFAKGFCLGGAGVRLAVAFGWLALTPIGTTVATSIAAGCLAYGAYQLFS